MSKFLRQLAIAASTVVLSLGSAGTVIHMETVSALAAQSSDFVIEDGLLTEYKGKGGDVVIPSGVEKIDDYVFSKRDDLTSVKIPSSVEAIGYGVFSDCTNLKKVELSKGILVIGPAAFRNCGNLTDIVLPEGISGIQRSTFQNCTSLKNITIPTTVWQIGEWAFKGCSGLTSVKVQEGINGIEYQAFYECKNLKSIDLPNGLEYIDRQAFYNCENLTRIVFPDSIKAVGNYAFLGCTSLTSVRIPSKLTELGKGVFSGCINLSSVVVDPNNSQYDSRNNCNAIIETSSNELVMGCKATKIPLDVTSIGVNSFTDCIGLTNINIPRNVTSIGAAAFAGCSGLTSITIPKNITTIEKLTFYGCSSLTKIIIPDNVTSIGSNAFADCKKLTSVKIPAKVTLIDSEAFWGCDNMTEVYLPSSVKEVGGTFAALPLAMKDIYYAGTKEEFEKIVFHGIYDCYGRLIYNTDVHYNCNIEYEKAEEMQKVSDIFTDVPDGAWYSDAILYVYNRGVMTGLSETIFGPKDKLSRAMTVTLLWRHEGLKKQELKSKPFPDVDINHWSANAVTWAKENGIVSGYSSGSKAGLFGRSDDITRQEFMVILYGYSKYKGFNTSVISKDSYKKIQDHASVSSWAREAMNWGYENGLIGNGGSFRAKDNIDRRETAMIITNFLEKYSPE